MNRTIKDALNLAQRIKTPIRYHQTIARRGYATDGSVETPLTTGEPETVPERPETLGLQLQQLVQGKRSAVFVSNASPNVVVPPKMKVVQTREGQIFFNPKKIDQDKVVSAVRNGELNKLLDYVQPKGEAQQQSFAQGVRPNAVVSRNGDGVEQDAAIVSPGNEEEQAQIFADRAEPGSTVGVEDPDFETVPSRMQFNRGGYATDGSVEGVPEEESQEDFIKKELEGSAKQYDPEAGILTGKRAGLMGAGFAPGSGLVTAAGKFPTAEGGFEPSVKEDIKNKHYGSAALKTLGAAGDVAYAIPFVGPAAGAALKLPLALKFAASIAPAAKVAGEAATAAREAAPVVEAAVEAAPQLTKKQSLAAMVEDWAKGGGKRDQYNSPHHQWNIEEKPKYDAMRPAATEVPKPNEVINPLPDFKPHLNPIGMASRGYEAAHTFLPESDTWANMQAKLVDQKLGAVKPEEMKWADFDYAPEQVVTREEIADKFKRAFPQVSRVKFGYVPKEIKDLEEATYVASDNASNAHANLLTMVDRFVNSDLNKDPNLHSSRVVNALYAGGDRAKNIYNETPQFLHKFMDEFVDANNKTREADAAYNDAYEAARKSGELNPANYESYSTPGGENYRISTLRLPHQNDVQGIHPSLQNEYDTKLADLNAKIEAQQEHVWNMDSEHEASVNEFLEKMKAERLQQMYDDPELMESWEKSRKDGIQPGVDTPLDVMTQKRDNLFKKIVDEEAKKNPEKMANALGLSFEWLEASQKPWQIIEEENKYREMARNERPALHAEYEAQSQALRAKDAPVYGGASFEHEPHSPGVRNPITQSRFKDREITDPETGQKLKVLSDEEQQSDWASEIRKHGGVDPIIDRQRRNLLSQLDEHVESGRKAADALRDWKEAEEAKIFDKIKPEVGPLWEKFNKSKQLKSDTDEFNRAYSPIFSKIEPELKELKTIYNKKYDEMNAAHHAGIEELQSKIEAIPEQRGMVSTVPYVGDDAHIDLGVKRMLQEALEGDYDRVFIPGSQEHARRYTDSFRQAVDHIRWEIPSKHEVSFIDNDGYRSTETFNNKKDAQDYYNQIVDKGYDEPKIILDEGGNEKTVYVKPVNSNSEEHLNVQPVTKNGKTQLMVVDSSVSRFRDKPLSSIVGSKMAKQIEDEMEGKIQSKNFMLGAEGYRSLYEEKKPAKLKRIIQHYFGEKPNVYAGVLPKGRHEGDVEGYWAHITPSMREKYKQRLKDQGYFFYGYKRGGAVSDKLNEITKRGLPIAERLTRADGGSSFKINRKTQEPVHGLKIMPPAEELSDDPEIRRYQMARHAHEFIGSEEPEAPRRPVVLDAPLLGGKKELFSVPYQYHPAIEKALKLAYGQKTLPLYATPETTPIGRALDAYEAAKFIQQDPSNPANYTGVPGTLWKIAGSEVPAVAAGAILAKDEGKARQNGRGPTIFEKLFDFDVAPSVISHPKSEELPMRLPYGQRYNEKTGELDSPESKGIGFRGPLSQGDHIVSEYSAERDISYPSIYEGIDKDDLANVMMAERLEAPPSKDVDQRAYEAAKRRTSEGKSPFFELGKDKYPEWSPDQDWPERKGYAEGGSAPYGVTFIGDEKVIIGSPHGQKAELSDDLKQKIQDIANKHGAYYEGTGGDIDQNKDFLPKYNGSWDDLHAKSVKGYPIEYLTPMFSNVDVNKPHETFVSPEKTIMSSLISNQDKMKYFKDRRYDEKALRDFLQAGSENDVDLLKMSQLPATKENLKKFFKTGESLTWPENWLEYPNKLGKLAKKTEDSRNQFLLNAPSGVYVAGAGHLPELKRLREDLNIIGGERSGD